MCRTLLKNFITPSATRHIETQRCKIYSLLLLAQLYPKDLEVFF